MMTRFNECSLLSEHYDRDYVQGVKPAACLKMIGWGVVDAVRDAGANAGIE
jgi:hypothetical protein